MLSISDCPEYDFTVRTDKNMTILVIRMWAASRYVWIIKKSYSACGLTEIKEMAAGTELFTISCCIAVGNWD